VNIAKVEALEAAGRMTPAGRAAFDRRKREATRERRLAQLVECSAARRDVPPLSRP
jgi:hypothetical protein